MANFGKKFRGFSPWIVLLAFALWASLDCRRFSLPEPKPSGEDYFPLEKIGEYYNEPLESIRHLELHSPRFRNEDLERLPPLPNLDFLSLGGTSITNMSRFNRRDYPKLRVLYLQETPVDDKSFRDWEDPPVLSELVVRKTRIRSLDWVKKFPKLRHLNLEETQVSDLEPLRNHRDIVTLYMGRTEVRDLAPIEDWENLEYLGVDYLFLSKKQIQDYRKKNPYTKVVRTTLLPLLGF